MAGQCSWTARPAVSVEGADGNPAGDDVPHRFRRPVFGRRKSQSADMGCRDDVRQSCRFRRRHPVRRAGKPRIKRGRQLRRPRHLRYVGAVDPPAGNIEVSASGTSQGPLAHSNGDPGGRRGMSVPPAIADIAALRAQVGQCQTGVGEIVRPSALEAFSVPMESERGSRFFLTRFLDANRVHFAGKRSSRPEVDGQLAFLTPASSADRLV